MHDNYGVKVTMYIFYEFSGKSLKNTTTKFKSEFEKNNSWLKFGFHEYNNFKDYSNLNVDEFLNDYETTVKKLENIVGEKSISSCLRLEGFRLSKENAKVLSENGVTSLLGADTDNRKDYFLSEEENKYLLKNDFLYSLDTNLKIYNTDLRIENMNFILYNKNYLQDEILVVFTHEWALDKINKIKINYLLNLLSYNNVEYSFLE